MRKATSSTSCSLIANLFGGGCCLLPRYTNPFTSPSFEAYEILMRGSLCSASFYIVGLAAHFKPLATLSLTPFFSCHTHTYRVRGHALLGIDIYISHSRTDAVYQEQPRRRRRRHFIVYLYRSANPVLSLCCCDASARASI